MSVGQSQWCRTVVEVVLNTNIHSLINKSVNDVIITHIYRESITVYERSN